jgi:ABC-2 type transport system permease protein
MTGQWSFPHTRLKDLCWMEKKSHISRPPGIIGRQKRGKESEMKLLDIAWKDISSSFRNYFAVMFMFGFPLLMGGMFYLMMGGSGSDGNAFSLPVTDVVVANLDRGGEDFEMSRAQIPGAETARSMGDIIASALQGKQFENLMKVTMAESAEAARSAVDTQAAGVAVIIPADFSEQFFSSSGQATIELYKDPTLTIGPGIVESILSQFIDGMSGVKIALSVVMARVDGADPQQIGSVLQRYMAGMPAGESSPALLDVHAPSSVGAPSNQVGTVVGLIMAGMTVFYAFFTGASMAQSILVEDEKGTLPRLFTTPTKTSIILGGKFLAVGVTVVVQMTVLVILGRWIFGIVWGSALPLTVVIIGSVAAASAFGIFVMSLLKNAKQAGTVFGAVITTTGMLGMIRIFTMGSTTSGALHTVSLLVPQGWAVRGLLETMNGAGLSDVLPVFSVLLAVSAVLFAIGARRFQKRYA